MQKVDVINRIYWEKLSFKSQTIFLSW